MLKGLELLHGYKVATKALERAAEDYYEIVAQRAPALAVRQMASMRDLDGLRSQNRMTHSSSF